jgi:histidine triad (HIT) family protein
LPAARIYEDESCVAFQDIAPKAPTHFLIIPRRHFATLADCGEGEEGLLGHMLLLAARLARERNVSSYRTVINTNSQAGQTVYHLHVHVLGGRTMRWPPG